MCAEGLDERDMSQEISQDARPVRPLSHGRKEAREKTMTPFAMSPYRQYTMYSGNLIRLPSTSRPRGWSTYSLPILAPYRAWNLSSDDVP